MSVIAGDIKSPQQEIPQLNFEDWWKRECRTLEEVGLPRPQRKPPTSYQCPTPNGWEAAILLPAGLTVESLLFNLFASKVPMWSHTFYAMQRVSPIPTRFSVLACDLRPDANPFLTAESNPTRGLKYDQQVSLLRQTYPYHPLYHGITTVEQTLYLFRRHFFHGYGRLRRNPKVWDMHDSGHPYLLKSPDIIIRCRNLVDFSRGCDHFIKENERQQDKMRITLSLTNGELGVNYKHQDVSWTEGIVIPCLAADQLF